MNVILDVNRHANDLWIGRASVFYSSDYAVLAVRFSIIPPWRHKPIGLQLALNLGAASWSKQSPLRSSVGSTIRLFGIWHRPWIFGNQSPLRVLETSEGLA